MYIYVRIPSILQSVSIFAIMQQVRLNVQTSAQQHSLSHFRVLPLENIQTERWF